MVRTLDGADKTFTADAGSKQSETLALSEGEHNIKLVVKNAAGSSQVRSFKVVAGQDVPGEVDSLTYAVDPSTGNDSLSWKAPKTSLHGGVVDDNTISYRVVRQPDNVVVAESQKATTFAEKLPTKRASYYYEVTSLANGKAGATATTDDAKLLAKLEAYRAAHKNDPKKTTGMAARLEALQKQMEEQQKNRNK